MNLRILLSVLCLSYFTLERCEGEIHSGVGIYDCTRAISDVNMMGMANPKQVASGLHQRLRSRAFVTLDTTTNKRIAFASLDIGMGGIVLKNRVVALLQKILKNNKDYTDENVALSGTHSHSGPGGFLQFTMLQFAALGWNPLVLESFVKCAAESIAMAHDNLQPATGTVAVGHLDGANINRSPTAHDLNPDKERKLYNYENTDRNMTQLKIIHKKNGTARAIFNWFAVHPTSLNNTNTLVSGDNKGHASYLLERQINGADFLPGRGPFVAAFASTNLGDVSPNTKGATCRDTGLPCDSILHSTCNGRNEQCSSTGPGKDMFESCEIIGRKQAEKALELFNLDGSKVTWLNSSTNADQDGGSVDFRQVYVDMPGYEVKSPETGKVVGKLCTAAMGDSFAAGTTDGPGQFDFRQGANSSNPFWHFISSILHRSTPEEKACQSPKSILLPTGSVNIPYPWAPSRLPFQILRWSQLVIVVVPTELTTMSGRRVRKAIKQLLVKEKVLNEKDGHVVIAGLANGYADYTTTFEEYQQQRYEGASTIFGPHQLNAIIQITSELATAMANGTSIEPGTPAEDFSHKCLNTGSGFKDDHLPKGATKYGEVMLNVKSRYQYGDTLRISFAGANPLNNPRLQKSYFEIQHLFNETWKTVKDDGDWETKIFVEKQSVGFLGLEHARVWHLEWKIPQSDGEHQTSLDHFGTPTGTYRIKFHGSWYNKPIFSEYKITPFEGVSTNFTITSGTASIFSLERILDYFYHLKEYLNF